MTWHPSYNLYASNGVTLIHSFSAIVSDNSPQDPMKGYEVEGSRGQGSLHVPGAEASWDLLLRFHIRANDYQALITLMDTIQSTIATNTRYILKIDRTPITTKNYNVMRKQPISWENTNRTSYQFGNIIFRVSSW
jgi:hypothetical protein